MRSRRDEPERLGAYPQRSPGLTGSGSMNQHKEQSMMRQQPNPTGSLNRPGSGGRPQQPFPQRPEKQPQVPYTWGPQLLQHEYPITPQKLNNSGLVGKTLPGDEETPPKIEMNGMNGHREGSAWSVATPQSRTLRNQANIPSRLGVHELLSERIPLDYRDSSTVGMQQPTLKYGPLPDFSVSGPYLGSAAAEQPLDELPPSVRSALNFLKTLMRVPNTQCREGEGFLPRRSAGPQRPTLVLDLDETLCHCCRDPNKRPKNANPADLHVHFEDPPHNGDVHFRPYAQLFLEVVSKKYEVVIFTASQPAYADKVIDALDENRNLISHRLYRQHCTEMAGAFFKELGRLARPVSQCILIDNSPISVACNPDNGILIRSWYGDPADRELVEVLQILESAQSYADYGRYLSSRYGLHDFFNALRRGHK